MTKRDYFATLTDLVNASTIDNKDDVLAFIANEIALLDKKTASAKKTAAKRKAAGDTLKTAIADALTADPASITDIATAVGTSNAKATARLTALVNDGKAVKSVIKVDKKKVTMYALA